MLLSRDAILAAEDRPTEDVDVPEWGGTVRLRALSGAERDAFETSLLDQRGKPAAARLQNFRARLLAASIVGEDGQRLFTDKDIVALGAKSGAVIDRLFERARRLSGMTREEVDALAGNSERGPSGDSISV